MLEQVKMTPYLLIMLLPRFISKGPNNLTPTLVKGGSSGVTLSFGKSAMSCSPFAARNLLQVTHLEIIFWMATTGIQNFCLRRAERVISAAVINFFMNMSDY